jgi:hypothetical protein
MVQREEMEVAVPAGAERVRDFQSEVADAQVLEKAKPRRFSASYDLGSESTRLCRRLWGAPPLT